MRRFNAKYGLSLALLAVLLLTLIFSMTISSVQPVTAQRPQRTPTSLRGTRVTIEIDMSNLQITLPAADDMMATANAMLESMSDADLDGLMATANAMLTAMPTFTGGLNPADLNEWLESWEGYNLAFDPDSGAMVVTVSIDEDMLNTVIEAALTEADTGVSSVSIEFDDELVVISADDVSLSSKLTGDLALSVELMVDDGAIVVTIVDATLNGKTIPPAILAELTTILETGFNDSLQTPDGLEYEVDDVVVKDDGIEVTLLLELSLE
jgi:hypothetical protein